MLIEETSAILPQGKLHLIGLVKLNSSLYVTLQKSANLPQPTVNEAMIKL